MLPIVSGTIRSTVKLAEMDSKWQQRKNSGKLLEKKDMDPLAKQILQYKDDMARMRESNKLADISAKVKAGSALTSEEIEYLQKNNPEIYREYVEVKSEKQAYERQLKSCKTKEDVERLKMTKMGSFMAEAKSVMNNPNLPKGKKLELAEKLLKKIMGVQKVHMKFVESEEYHSLPTEEELAREAEDKAEQTEESVENIKEGIQKDLEFTEELRKTKRADMEIAIFMNAADSLNTNSVNEEPVKSADTQSEIKLPELKKQADMDYEAIKAYVINYIRENRSRGYGMEYLEEDLDKAKKHR